jgi:AcrR family transcriptional regulator
MPIIVPPRNMTKQSQYVTAGRKKSTPSKKKAAGGGRTTERRPGRPGGVRDTNRRERMEALAAAAMQLFLARGIEQTTIDDITSAAGVSKGSFYRYFEDKTALVDHLLAPVREELVGALEACSRALDQRLRPEALNEVWRVLGEALAGTVFTHVGMVRLYLQESRGPATGARTPLVALSNLVGRHAIEITRRAHAQGLFRASIHPTVSALAVVGTSERLLAALFAGEDIGNPLEVPGALTSLIMDGLWARNGP